MHPAPNESGQSHQNMMRASLQPDKDDIHQRDLEKECERFFKLQTKQSSSQIGQPSWCLHIVPAVKVMLVGEVYVRLAQALNSSTQRYWCWPWLEWSMLAGSFCIPDSWCDNGNNTHAAACALFHKNKAKQLEWSTWTDKRMLQYTASATQQYLWKCCSESHFDGVFYQPKRDLLAKCW